MRKLNKLLFSFILFSASLALAEQRPSTGLERYFEGTDYELSVYTINGRTDGATMLIVGGIQGDEPGGYLSADLYSELKLEKGNLIVIPRANLKSVLLFNRAPDGDMNRMFVDNVSDSAVEEVVKVIIANMERADIFLNLHDGWGYYSPVYVDSERNPNRFGQSIIVDEDNFTCKDGRVLDLKGMAQTVLEAVNARIPEKRHQMAYFNTTTSSPDSMYKSMQKTATWYALRKECIPAFGIESSKNIASLDLKVLYHNYAVNEFMKIMDIVPEYPPIYTVPAELSEALVTVNGESVSVRNGEILHLKKNDSVGVSHIEANYERGVVCDILGYGSLNDINQDFQIAYTTKLVFRKDDKKFAEVVLEVENGSSNALVTTTSKHFRLELNGKILTVANGGSIDVKNSDTLKIIGLAENGKLLDFAVNLRGWVSPGSSINSGDDRGLSVTIRSSDMLARFAVADGLYPITVDDATGKEIAKMYIRILK